MLVLMSLSGRDWAGVAGSPGVVSCAYQRPPDQPYLTEPLLSTTVLYGKGAPQSRGSQGEQILAFSSSIRLALFSFLSPSLPHTHFCCYLCPPPQGDNSEGEPGCPGNPGLPGPPGLPGQRGEEVRPRPRPSSR